MRSLSTAKAPQQPRQQQPISQSVPEVPKYYRQLPIVSNQTTEQNQRQLHSNGNHDAPSKSKHLTLSKSEHLSSTMSSSSTTRPFSTNSNISSRIQTFGSHVSSNHNTINHPAVSSTPGKTKLQLQQEELNEKQKHLAKLLYRTQNNDEANKNADNKGSTIATAKDVSMLSSKGHQQRAGPSKISSESHSSSSPAPICQKEQTNEDKKEDFSTTLTNHHRLHMASVFSNKLASNESAAAMSAVATKDPETQLAANRNGKAIKKGKTSNSSTQMVTKKKVNPENAGTLAKAPTLTMGAANLVGRRKSQPAGEGITVIEKTVETTTINMINNKKQTTTTFHKTVQTTGAGDDGTASSTALLARPSSSILPASKSHRWRNLAVCNSQLSRDQLAIDNTDSGDLSSKRGHSSAPTDLPTTTNRGHSASTDVPATTTNNNLTTQRNLYRHRLALSLSETFAPSNNSTNSKGSPKAIVKEAMQNKLSQKRSNQRDEQPEPQGQLKAKTPSLALRRQQQEPQVAMKKLKTSLDGNRKPEKTTIRDFQTLYGRPSKFLNASNHSKDDDAGNGVDSLADKTKHLSVTDIGTNSRLPANPAAAHSASAVLPQKSLPAVLSRKSLETPVLDLSDGTAGILSEKKSNTKGLMNQRRSLESSDPMRNKNDKRMENSMNAKQHESEINPSVRHMKDQPEEQTTQETETFPWKQHPYMISEPVVALPIHPSESSVQGAIHYQLQAPSDSLPPGHMQTSSLKRITHPSPKKTELYVFVGDENSQYHATGIQASKLSAPSSSTRQFQQEGNEMRGATSKTETLVEHSSSIVEENASTEKQQLGTAIPVRRFWSQSQRQIEDDSVGRIGDDDDNVLRNSVVLVVQDTKEASKAIRKNKTSTKSKGSIKKELTSNKKSKSRVSVVSGGGLTVQQQEYPMTPQMNGIDCAMGYASNTVNHSDFWTDRQQLILANSKRVFEDKEVRTISLPENAKESHLSTNPGSRDSRSPWQEEKASYEETDINSGYLKLNPASIENNHGTASINAIIAKKEIKHDASFVSESSNKLKETQNNLDVGSTNKLGSISEGSGSGLCNDENVTPSLAKQATLESNTVIAKPAQRYTAVKSTKNSFADGQQNRRGASVDLVAKRESPIQSTNLQQSQDALLGKETVNRKSVIDRSRVVRERRLAIRQREKLRQDNGLSQDDRNNECNALQHEGVLENMLPQDDESVGSAKENTTIEPVENNSRETDSESKIKSHSKHANVFTSLKNVLRSSKNEINENNVIPKDRTRKNADNKQSKRTVSLDCNTTETPALDGKSQSDHQISFVKKFFGGGKRKE